MAEFIYAYRKSDGQRCEAAIKAESRDAAFAALRAQGIRPIKVIAKNGSKANGEVFGVRKRLAVAGAVLALLVGVIAGILTERRLPGQDEFDGCSQEEKTRLTRLVADSDRIRETFKREYATTGLENISEATDFAKLPQARSFYAAVDRGMKALSQARKDTQSTFTEAAKSFETDGRALRAVQRLYGERMAEIDAAEIVHSNRRFAYALLDANRSAWTVTNGVPVFSDKRLGEMFQYCLDGIRTDAATSRWHQDFGGK